MEICHLCGLPVKTREAVWLERPVSRQTLSEPAEWESQSFHAACAGEDDRDPAYERAAANYGGQGRDWR